MKRIGWEGVLKRGTAGSSANTTILNCQDASYGVTPEKGDTSSRASRFSVERVTLIGISIEWTMLQDENDTSLTALKAAAVAGTAVALLTEDYASGYGVDGDFTVGFDKGEPLRGEQTVKFTATPTDENGRFPTWS